jgi:hypothetical protein
LIPSEFCNDFAPASYQLWWNRELKAMTVENLTTARFVLQCLFNELEEYDRCIPVARDIRVGDVADALLVVLSNRELERLAMPARVSPHRRQTPRPARPVAAKRKSRKPRVSRTA